MSNSVHIGRIESLEQLRIAIARFCDESENQLQAIDSKLQSRIGDLKSLESQFKNMIESAEDDLRSAKRSLSSCESNSYDDEDGEEVPPNCDYEKEEEINCKKRLELAEHNYSSFKREIRNLEISIEEYQKPKIKYKTLIQFEKEAAIGSLKQLINGAEDYLSVTSPLENGLSNGLGLTEAIAKIDPTMIVAATVGVAEIMMMSVFSFLGLAGNLFSVSNKKKNGIVTTAYTENGTEHICSELKIEKRESGNFGKILSVNIPPSLQTEKVGKHLVGNMEATCRANDCKEINGWTNSNNIPFYKGLGYDTRNEIKETGGEVFKPLESNFFASQQSAKAAFQTIDDSSFQTQPNTEVQLVNPMKIISLNLDNDEIFWKQHVPEGLESYIDLIDKYDKYNQLSKAGKTYDEIHKQDSAIANAYNVMHGTYSKEIVELKKIGDCYQLDGGGRHRMTAAQIYYLRTGKVVLVPSKVRMLK